MDAASKNKSLEEARAHVAQTIDEMQRELPILEKEVAEIERDLRQSRTLQSTIVSQNILAIKRSRLASLRNAYHSPYFARCDIAFTEKGGEREVLYFGKFSQPESSIYSWVSAAAQTRFNTPGPFAYRSETGKSMTGNMDRVDQYMIAQQNITFMTTEMIGMPRTLLYHERFSQHKSEFVLPEIVERMERAQDDIIRADAQGSFLISGPAGSGKTTLALHRIVYLLQSPEHAARFDPRKIAVLVQDNNSKQYFEKLLPSLGIVDVSISTFDQWALNLLGIKNATYVSRYGNNEQERDIYEASKYQALKAKTLPIIGKDHFARLESIYHEHFSDDQKKSFTRQRKDKLLDRFDLTILLQGQIAEKGKLTVREKVYSTTVRGGFKSRMAEVDVKHPLILIDEVQNYLAEQITILKSCISSGTGAMTYVGDLAQQTSLFTFRDWSSVREKFEQSRSVHLYKVYRSTRQILSYIRSVGFDIEIPDGIREGAEVYEEAVSGTNAFHKVEDLIKDKKDILIGIVVLRPEDRVLYLKFESPLCKVMTAVEAQGLEFDLVVFIPRFDVVAAQYTEELIKEKQKVIRDQIYVALTRAINELYILSEEPLSSLVFSLYDQEAQLIRSRGI
jgi:DNA helicase IV